MTQTPVPIDLETTGLHPADDAILEFAMLLVDRDLDVVADFGNRVVFQPEDVLEARMNDYVRRMHTDNGLLEAVRESDLRLDAVDEEAADWLHEHGVAGDGAGIVLGSSCRLDLYMIELQMPRLARLLTHRMIDVSGVRESLNLYLPGLELADDARIHEHVPAGEGATSHRAHDDIRWTLGEARCQRETLRGLIRP
ncbi:exonuclease domain-containing protein [Brevibacterium oceani]|uniref:exonuclease domain-containing protein n=1 Tax=Brevibacterium oceani TaxID=358099 RepID=UPI0015E72DB4|nr:exonuclease domain-containing protein [Brevibacterium oceani]